MIAIILKLSLTSKVDLVTKPVFVEEDIKEKVIEEIESYSKFSVEHMGLDRGITTKEERLDFILSRLYEDFGVSTSTNEKDYETITVEVI